jgi:hypothetical protein
MKPSRRELERSSISSRYNDTILASRWTAADLV